jgi:hypothetical protein
MIRKRMQIKPGAILLADSVISRIEHGHYEELSDGMSMALLDAVNVVEGDFTIIADDLNRMYGTPYLDEAYKKWRQWKRSTTGDHIEWPRLHEVVLESLELGVSPMAVFVKKTSKSLNSFCSELCLQVPTMERFIEGRFNYLLPPATLVEALKQARYAEADTLFELQQEWIDEQ